MITHNDKPVTNPFMAALCLVALAFGLTVLAIGMVLLPFLLLIAALVHPFLWFAGRRGCIREGGKHIIFDKTSFDRR